MRTGSPNKDSKHDLNFKLKMLGIGKLEREYGFVKRRAGKIKIRPFLLSFFRACFDDGFSLSNWAFQLSLLEGKSISKQAVFYRLDSSFIALLKTLLEKALVNQMQTTALVKSKFKNVYIQDGTTLKLPDNLNTVYKGNYSRGETKSVAKLQVIYNATKRSFQSILLTPFTKNDQAASIDILPMLRKGDLVIRDMGYFVLSTFREIIQKKADFISRYKKDVTISDINSGESLPILKILKGKDLVKRKVLVGVKEQLPCTLIAIKLCSKVAEARRRKAIKDRDQRLRYTKEKKILLGWDIYLCSDEGMEIREVQNYYETRWQIEIIFKSWKSGLHLESSIPRHLKYAYLAETVIYLQMLFVVLMLTPIYNILRAIQQRNNRQISLLKTIKIALKLLLSNGLKLNTKIAHKLSCFTLYEVRKRTTMEEKLRILA
jgi:hypothetical protein